MLAASSKGVAILFLPSSEKKVTWLVDLAGRERGGLLCQRRSPTLPNLRVQTCEATFRSSLVWSQPGVMLLFNTVPGMIVTLIHRLVKYHLQSSYILSVICTPGPVLV